MGYKAFACMNIAIIGNGKTSVALAQGLALAGHEILLADNSGNTNVIFDFLADEFHNIHETTMEHAAAAADLIIIATAPEEVRAAAYFLDDVRKKVIIDTSFMNAESFDKYINTVSAIQAITGSQHVVKCFNSSGYELTGVGRSESTINMFVAGDDRKAKEMARLIARDLGLGECHDFGGTDSVPLLDEMAICHHHLTSEKDQEKVVVKTTKH